MRREFESIFQLAKNLPLESLPEFFADLEHIRMAAFARMVIPTSEAIRDELLDVEQAAARMNVSMDYLYRRHKRLPFTRRMGKRLLFSSNGLDSFLKKSR
jgi:excisionase family DNA binding protein